MNDITTEPEQTLEAAVVDALHETCNYDVFGFLRAEASGDEKLQSDDTYILVTCDVEESTSYEENHIEMMVLGVTVTVRCAQCDDRRGEGFADECNRARHVLAALTGNGCETLTRDNLHVDGFILVSTHSSYNAGDNPVRIKQYQARAYCRIVETQEEVANGN